MSMIITRCPWTGQEIATGIDTDPSSFKCLPDIPADVHCPACGRQHPWRKSQAWLAHDRASRGNV